MYIKLKRQLLGSHGVQIFHIKLNIHPGTPQEWLHACHNSFRKVSERSQCISWSLLVKEDQIKLIIKATF